MKYYLNFYVALIALFLMSCKAKDINKITGYQKVDTGMEARKYQDKEGEVYYVNVLGEHGDEGTARRYCIQNAAREFGLKANQMIEAANNLESGASLRDKVGKLSVKEKSTAVSRVVTNDMVLEEDQLFYNPDTQVYQYRAVYSVQLDKVVKRLLDN